jgi:hypothetical protein
MKRIAWAVVVVFVVGSLFFLAPIVYSPSHLETCGGPPLPSGKAPGCGWDVIPAYESLSCVLFRVGVAGGQSFTSDKWSYYLGCAPDKTLTYYLY